MSRLSLILVLLLGAVAWAEPDGPSIIPVLTHVESTFGDGADGWTSSDGDAALVSAGSGLEVRDISNDWHWITAPAKFHGDWRQLGRVTLAVRGDDAILTESVRLRVGSPHGTAVFTFPREAVVPGEWQTLGVPLDAAQWTVTGDWDSILATVEAFRIRLDLHAGTDETEGLLLVRLEGGPVSTFVSSPEGWTATDDAGLTIEAGTLRVRDVAKGWVWLVAPWTFRGVWRRHGRLSFDLRGPEGAALVYPVVVEIRGGASLARHVFPLDAVTPGAWRTLSLPLDEALWTVAGDWAALLANVEDLRIRLDLTGAWGGDAEVTGFDNARLSPR